MVPSGPEPSTPLFPVTMPVAVSTTASGVTSVNPEPPSEIRTFGPMVTVLPASS
jgi:hypothetical protein